MIPGYILQVEILVSHDDYREQGSVGGWGWLGLVGW